MVTTAGKKVVLARESSDGIVILLALTVGSDVFYFTNNFEDITTGGHTYTAWPFKLALATDNNQSPEMRLQISNVDKRIMEALDGITDPPTVSVSCVLISDPATVQRGFSGFKLREVRADPMMIEGVLGQERLASEIWPKIRATPSRCPSLF